jgi:archaellum component FlaC
MASSMGGGMGGGGVNGGLRNMNKKLMGLQKDLEGYKASLDQVSFSLQDVRDEFVRVYEKIEATLARAEEIEVKRQGMEMSFIKALRRAGMDKKQQKTQVSAQIDSAELKKIHEKINRKNKKIKTMTTYVEKAAADIMLMKDKHNAKINEIVKSLKFLDEARVSSVLQVKNVAEEVKKVEKSMKGSFDDVQSQIKTLQGPLTDLISDQQRENELLSNSLKNHQTVLNELVAEIAKYKPDVKVPKGSSGSPSLSVKHKLATGFRRTSVSTSKNWLEDIPDGVALTLPRVNYSSHSKKLSY